jgi:hypothetical protein
VWWRGGGGAKSILVSCVSPDHSGTDMQDLSSHKLLPIMPTNTCQLFLHADNTTTTNTSNDHLYKLQSVSGTVTGIFKNNSIPQT